MKLFNDFILRAHDNLTSERRQYWYDRGFNDWVLDYFKIGYYRKRQSYIFPYFDQKGNCYFYKGISIDKRHYWYPLSGEFVRIFNIADIKEAREKKQRLYICEGEKDCMVFKMQGVLCIGISGTNGFKEEYLDVEVI